MARAALTARAMLSEAKPVESTSSFHRFRVNAELNKTAELVVEEVQPLESHFSL